MEKAGPVQGPLSRQADALLVALSSSRFFEVRRQGLSFSSSAPFGLCVAAVFSVLARLVDCLASFHRRIRSVLDARLDLSTCRFSSFVYQRGDMPVRSLRWIVRVEPCRCGFPSDFFGRVIRLSAWLARFDQCRRSLSASHLLGVADHRFDISSRQDRQRLGSVMSALCGCLCLWLRPDTMPWRRMVKTSLSSAAAARCRRDAF